MELGREVMIRGVGRLGLGQWGWPGAANRWARSFSVAASASLSGLSADARNC